MSLISHLATYRKAAGLTQAQLAAAVGVSRKTINTVENQVFIPSTVLSLKLARYLRVSVEELFVLAQEDEVGD